MKKVTLAISLTLFVLTTLFAQWTTVGNSRFSDSLGTNFYQDLAVDYAGVPYVAFQNSADSGKISVMKFNGTNWVAVGSDFPVIDSIFPFAGNVFYSTDYVHPKIEFDNSNVPYVAYSDGVALFTSANVVEFNGTSWLHVGASNFKDSVVYGEFDFAISPGGEPYIAFAHGAKQKITVMKYAFSNWSIIGTADFSDSIAKNVSLSFDNTGTPYVLYMDLAHGRKSTVQKYTGSGLTGWQVVGTPGYSTYESPINRGALVLGKNNTPYTTYYDGNLNIVVAHFNGASWVFDTIDNTASVPSMGRMIKMAADNDKNLFVAYRDHQSFGGYYVVRYDSAANRPNNSKWVNEGEPTTYVSHTNMLGDGYPNDPLYLAIDNSASNPVPYVAFLDTGTQLTVKKYNCRPATSPVLPSAVGSCRGSGATLAFYPDSLNDSDFWHWYSDSCGGNSVSQGWGNSIAVTPNDTTVYYVRAEGYCSTTSNCSNIIVNVWQDTIPTVNILASPGDTICTGATVVFSPTPFHGGQTPSYRWYKNGSYLGSSFQYTNNSLSEGDVVWCVLTSSESGCVRPDTALSNSITMKVDICNGVQFVDGNEFNLYPNPASNLVIIESPASVAGPGRVMVMDVTGNKIQSVSRTGNDKIILDVTSFTPGIYLVTFSDSKNIFTSRFIKM